MLCSSEELVRVGVQSVKKWNVEAVGPISYAAMAPRPWLILVMLASMSAIWLCVDSVRRHLPASAWRWASYLLVLSTFPGLIYPALGVEARGQVETLVEPLTYLGLMGALVPPLLLLFYSLSYRGRVGCVRGHVYARTLGVCPSCHSIPLEFPMASSSPVLMAAKRSRVAGAREARTKTQAWLVATDGLTFQLNREVTTVGKSSQSDFQITTDNTVSRLHLKIVEKDGSFVLFDLGSTNGTRVNGMRVDEPLLLEADDVIELGDNTSLTFFNDMDAVWRRNIQEE